MLKYRIRRIEKADIEEVLDLEKLANSYMDTDFERRMMRPWGLDKERLIGLVKQRTDPNANTHEVSLNVVELRAGHWVCCAVFAYEIHEDCYAIIHLTLHPQCEQREVLEAVTAWFSSKMKASFRRRLLRIIVPDADEGGLRPKWSYWKSVGGKVRLLPDYYHDDTDAYEVELKEHEEIFDEL